MMDWSQPTGFQIEALHDALSFAYPTPELFGQFLFLKLNKNYNHLAPAGQPFDVALLGTLMRAMADGWLPQLVAKALQDKPNSPKLKLLNHVLPLTAAEVPAPLGTLEDIVRKTVPSRDLFPWIEGLGQLGQRVCRIEYPINQAWGTGWLVAADLVLTNWHVIRRALPGGEWQPSAFACRFDYAVRNGVTQEGSVFQFANDWLLASSPASASELGTGSETPTVATLDYAVLRLASPIGAGNAPSGGKRGWVELSSKAWLPAAEAAKPVIIVVQHPDGEPVKLAIGSFLGEAEGGMRLRHDANTIGGSSGSPVVDAALKPVALHHAGDLLYHQTSLGKPEVNQAVPLSLIIQDLQKKQLAKFWAD